MTLTPRVLRWIVAGLAMVVLLTAWMFPPTPRSEVTVRFVYSNDAADLVEPLIEEFNATHADEIEIVGSVSPSGAAEQQMATSTPDVRPDVWMPASSVWGELLNEDTGSTWYRGGSSFFWSPMAVVTWRSIDSLSPTAGWDELLALITDEKPLSDYGVDGEFRFAHTKPTTSTSGLFETVAEFSEAAGTPHLTVDQVRDGTVVARVGDVEANLVHYGDIGKDFCELIDPFGLTFLTATYMQETVMRTCAAETASDLRAIFPDAKAFVADYPCVVLDAPWNSERTQAAADDVCSWLGERLTDDPSVETQYFRPGPAPIGGTTFTAPDPDGGPPLEIEALPIPAGDVLAAVRDRWREVRKRADVVILHDVSGEMTVHSDDAVEVTEALVEGLDVGDRSEVIAVDGDLETVKPSGTSHGLDTGPLTANGTGPNHMFDAIAATLQRDDLRDGGSINVIVVVSAGVNDTSKIELEELEAMIDRYTRGKFPVQIITVTFGDEQGSADLQAISEAAYSRSFDTSDPEMAPEEIADAIAKAL